MTILASGRFYLAIGTILTLAACQTGNGQVPFSSEHAAASAADAGADSAAPEGEGKDVEAPQVFNLTDMALWDGRPSLGGVWVAHTSVKEPERVIIRNTANGKSTIGALFRREIDNPGPSLQLSSDAAEALGLLAGQPGKVTVVALRKAEPAAAKAAPAAADTTKGATTAATPAAGAKAATAAGSATASGDGAATAPAKTEKTKKKGQKTTGGSAIEETTLESNAAAAIEKSEDQQQTQDAKSKGKAAKASTTAPATSPVAAAPAVAGTEASAPSTPAKRAYIQIGIFSVEANAKKAAAQMTAAGMSAQVKSDTSQGKTFWRVIIGPVATVGERDAMAAKVKALGYPDSYPVSK